MRHLVILAQTELLRETSRIKVVENVPLNFHVKLKWEIMDIFLNGNFLWGVVENL